MCALDRIEEVTNGFLNRSFAFDQFGPLSIRPHDGSTWARQSKPIRWPATYHLTNGIRYFHGCYSLGDDKLWGVNRRRKGGDQTLTALKSIRAARPDGAPIYVNLDNLSANRTTPILAWAKKNTVELCFTPTSASWANPIEAQFGPLRTWHHERLEPPQPRRSRDRPAGLPARWHHANARHPDVNDSGDDRTPHQRHRGSLSQHRQPMWPTH